MISERERRVPLPGGAEPGGEEWKDGAVTSARGRAAPDGSFALLNLVPGTWEFEVRAAGGWIAPQRIEVPAGDDARERRIVATPGAVLELTPERAPGSGWIEPAFADADGAWQVPSVVHSEREPPHVFTRAFAPGVVRWRMRFLAEPWNEASRFACDPQGTVTLAAGETLRVTVPVEPLD